MKRNIIIRTFVWLSIAITITACESKDESAYFIKTIDFGKNDQIQSVIITSKGEPVVCGSSNSIMSSDDLLAMKLSSTGNMLWAKTFGSPRNDRGIDVIQASDGNLCLGGSLYYNNSQDIYLLKINPLGQLIWAITLGGTEVNTTHAVYPNETGGCYVIGSTDRDMLIINISQTGNIIWSRSMGKLKGYDYSRSMHQLPGGNLLISGNTNSFEEFQLPFITCLNADGHEQWTSVLQMTEDHLIYDMAAIENDGIYLTGSYTYDAITKFNHAILIKTDMNGNMLWKKIFSGNSAKSVFYDIELTRKNELLLTGYVLDVALKNQLRVTKVNMEGNILWTREFGTDGIETGYKSKEFSNGDIITAGTVQDTKSGTMFTHIIVLKMTKDGYIPE